jgi:two-component system NtrC family sensor kinase
MANEHILLISSRTSPEPLLDQMVLINAGLRLTSIQGLGEAESVIKTDPPDVIILGEQLDSHDAFTAAGILSQRHPFIPLQFLPEQHSEEKALSAYQAGFSGYIHPAFNSGKLLECLRSAFLRHRQLEEYARLLAKRDTKTLQKKVNGLETIERIGRKVTSILELDNVLAAIVDAAVELSGAEEGSLLLPDPSTGELFIRASRNFQEDFVQTFRLPIQDSLAGKVMQSGKPILIDEKTPQKIKTAYLVHTLIYLPITVKERVIGVLEVDNRQSGKPFSENHMMLLTALSDFAAVALENAQLYAHSEAERKKLETILTGIENGVIVADYDGRLILMNRKAREAFGIRETSLTGKRVRDFIQHQDLLDVLRDDSLVSATRVEIALEDGRVMNTQITPIPEIGLVVIMQDITHLKELDRIKTEFVNTVSHDLRSPLTAILGYVELIDRVGTINKQQQEFIRRVQLSVHSITALINDLLDLGRIETGFDARKEIIPFTTILDYSIEGQRNLVDEKSQILVVEGKDALPQVLGNPIRLRQMVTNLLANAIKYTKEGGEIHVSTSTEAGQIILQITDNGPGIPPADQPYIFDKFYRASNISSDIPGSGLGLAIVKSIVENHLGRIWVDSTLGQGTTFTVVLPSIDSVL